jgi:MFS family permease
VAAPALDLDVRAVQRRTLTVLTLSHVIGGMGMGIGIAVGALLAESLGGTAVSGFGQSALVIGAAVLAVPVSRVMRRYGGRVERARGGLVLVRDVDRADGGGDGAADRPRGTSGAAPAARVSGVIWGVLRCG